LGETKKATSNRNYTINIKKEAVRARAKRERQEEGGNNREVEAGEEVRGP